VEKKKRGGEGKGREKERKEGWRGMIFHPPVAEVLIRQCAILCPYTAQ